MDSAAVNRKSVLMIGIDASEVSLIDEMSSRGELPAIRALRDRGCFGRLESKCLRFVGGVWPTFYTGRDVPWHGLYHNKLWRHEHMRCEVPSEEWLSEPPFWQKLEPADYRIAVLDVPSTLGWPRPINGIELRGWGAHDLMSRGSWPTELWKELQREFARPAMRREFFGPQNATSLSRLRTQLLEATEQQSRIAASQLQREAWDLFLVVFGATHRGGHYLWDLSQIDSQDLTVEKRDELAGGLRDVYRACDRAVGELVERAPTGARVLVFTLHGMGANCGWADRTSEILAKIQRTPPRTGLLYSLKQRLPWQLMRQVTTRLPERLSEQLTRLWSSRMFDWQSTRYFPVPMDHAGYIRINLKGREPKGIVEPGVQYEALCAEVADALFSFRDLDSGEPIVGHVYRLDEMAPADAPYRDRLPDLVVTWNDVIETPSRAIRSESYGELIWESRKVPSGRSGNHLDHGWFVAAGNGIQPGRTPEDHSILDLVPTVARWLGAPRDPGWQGTPIPSLLGSTT